MKYLLFISIALLFSSCLPGTTQVPCYYVITAIDPLMTCSSNPNHTATLNWSFGTYQMNNISNYTTTEFKVPEGLNSNIGMTLQSLNRCNNFKVDFYINGVLSDSQTAELGYQSDCQTYCADGHAITMTFAVP